MCVLASDSKGNATFLRVGDERYLIDAGISAKRIKKALSEIGEDISELDGVIITHEHIDHISGIKALTQMYQLKFWLSFETYKKIQKKVGNIDAEFIEVGEEFKLGKNLLIMPYEIPHDAIDPVAFLVKSSHGDPIIGYLMDCGRLNPYLIDGFRKVKILIIESNHSFDLLLQSDYPTCLKQRILGSKGHLSNWDVGRFIIETHPSIVVLSHLSENNNHPGTALSEIEEIFACYMEESSLPFIVVVNKKSRSTLIISDI
jgi:phosphoribosyl 1,2-cyclic phosphodiesterase